MLIEDGGNCERDMEQKLDRTKKFDVAANRGDERERKVFGLCQQTREAAIINFINN